MLSLSVSLTVKSDRLEEFLQAITRNRASALANEPGCLRFDIGRDSEQPEVFHLHEVYQDEAAFQQHKESAHFLAWREIAAQVLQAGGRTSHLSELMQSDLLDARPVGSHD